MFTTSVPPARPAEGRPDREQDVELRLRRSELQPRDRGVHVLDGADEAHRYRLVRAVARAMVEVEVLFGGHDDVVPGPNGSGT